MTTTTAAPARLRRGTSAPARRPGLWLLALPLFIGYLRMAWSMPVNADAASYGLQAWDLWHGNPLLHGWTLSDVSFFGTELAQYALLEMLIGLHPETVHVAAALTYTLLVVLVCALARGGAPGSATGRTGLLRMAVAAGVMLVPSPGLGYQTLLLSPDHTGSAVPILLGWLLLDRCRTPRWWLPPAVGLLLAWGQVGDPLVTFVGAAPLVLVSTVRAVRAGSAAGPDARLAVAGFASVGLAHAVLGAVRALGGFVAPSPPTGLAGPADLPHRAEMTLRMLGVVFGVDGLNGWALMHLPGVAVVLVALARMVHRRGRVNLLLSVGALIDVGAEAVSTLPADIHAAREIAPVLPLCAVLAGRVCAARLPRAAVYGLVGALAAALAGYVPRPAPPVEYQSLADWLDGHGLRYGLGSFWTASNLTVATDRRVRVVPVAGTDRVATYCWQTKAGWYDPHRHDARFVVWDRRRSEIGPIDVAIGRFGPPVVSYDLGQQVVLVYDHNLLTELPPYCH